MTIGHIVYKNNKEREKILCYIAENHPANKIVVSIVIESAHTNYRIVQKDSHSTKYISAEI